MRTESCVIKVRGMICRSCTDEVEALLTHRRGVISAKLSYMKSSATVEYDPDIVSISELEAAISSSGYETGDRGLSTILVDIICVALTVALVLFFTYGSLNPIPEVKEGASLGYIFLIGLMSGTHCIGMCGGILMSQSSGSDKSGKRRDLMLPSLYYNCGRTLSYTVLGAVFGALGTVISYDGDTRSMLFCVIGLAVLLIGINMWGLIPGLGAIIPTGQGFCRLPKKTRGCVSGRPLIIGALTGFMPCGTMYAMWLLAMSSGNAVRGAEIMLFFALGTLPLMFCFGALNSFVPRKYMKYMLKLSAVLVTALGIKMFISGIT